MNKILFGLLVIVLVAFGFYYVSQQSNDVTAKPQTTSTQTMEDGQLDASAGVKDTSVLGTSVQGNNIVAYHFGNGEKEILFVGGIHGGYEWNTALLGFQVVDYLKAHPEAVPVNETITIIPVLNPDGLASITGTTTAFAAKDVNPSQGVQVTGRFNGNTVDLNRNFDCDWQAKGTWQNKPVSGGTAAFSEPESRALRDYVQAHTPVAVVAWFSAAGGVYASGCGGNVLLETTPFTNVYAKASGYPAHETFDSYATTGDMTNWLAKIGVPAISVLLTNHTDIEWDKNLAGIEAVLQYFAQQTIHR